MPNPSTPTAPTAAIGEHPSYARTVIDSAFDGILGLDAELVCVSANPAAARLVEAEEELVGRPLLDVLPELSRNVDADLGRPLGEAILGPLCTTPFRIVRRRDRELSALELTAAAAEVEGRHIWVVVCRDITLDHVEHKRLVQAHKELEEFNRMTVDRELRMIELKREVNALLAERGEEAKYDIVD